MEKRTQNKIDRIISIIRSQNMFLVQNSSSVSLFYLNICQKSKVLFINYESTQTLFERHKDRKIRIKITFGWNV